MSAGNCTGCGGDGTIVLQPSERRIRHWACKGTGNYPPPRNPIIAWWYRVTNQFDKALDRLGILP
jgi:hypothetical protein